MSPRRRNPIPDDPRLHLMDAALRAFARDGYQGTSVRQIAAEAGVATGLLYHYFPSKEALLQALFERSGALVMHAFALAAGEPDPRQRLARLLRVSAELVREHQDFWRISYGVRFQQEVVAGLAPGIAASSAAYVLLFADLLGQLGHPSPEVGARLLFATMDGLFQHYVLDPEGYPLDDVIEGLIVQTLMATPPTPEAP